MHRWGILSMAMLAYVAGDLEAGPRHVREPFRTGRSVVMAPGGMVATSHPLAAQVGLQILRDGGNAIDAAIATNAAIGLMEPMSCGIGGDLFAIVWHAETKTLHGLNASGRAPARATRQYFAGRGLEQIPGLGPLSWSVPGCVDGWFTLHEKFGKTPMADILKPSIAYAESGFPVTEVIAGYWKGAEKKLRSYPDPGVYLPVPAAGEVFKNPALARTYRLLAENGRDAFYRGEIAEELVRFSDAHGGLFSREDFEKHASTWVDPVSTNYRGYDVWELPPNGQGIAALQMLNILEGYDLKSFGPKSADYWHLWTEAKKLAYADRARFYADPAFAEAPVDRLISKAYAEERRKLIRMDGAMTRVDQGDPSIGRGDTIYLCVVDEDRNCVSLIQSLYQGFGSGMTPAKLGFAIQNRGTSFALAEDHPNRLEPGKRPFHTIIPAMVTKDGGPWFVFGVMGGDMQPQGHVQVLVNMIDFGMDVQQAGEALRLEHLGSAKPTGQPGDPDGGEIQAEVGIDPAVVAGLRERGHRVRMIRTNGGGYQGILIDPRTNMLFGGSEARKDGAAVGY